MVNSWDENFIRAKYHLAIARRLFENFENFETKRFLSGMLTEMAKSATMIVNTVIIYSHDKHRTRIPIDPQARIKIFQSWSNKHMSKKETEEILAVFAIKKAQKQSPVELLKEDKKHLQNKDYRIY
jgi:hypothetical protein